MNLRDLGPSTHDGAGGSIYACGCRFPWGESLHPCAQHARQVKRREPSCSNNHEAQRWALHDLGIAERDCPNCGWTLKAARIRDDSDFVLVDRAALDKYVAWFGGMHDEDCPADDTCSCSGHDVNEAINAAFRE